MQNVDKYKWISKTYRPYNYEVNYREIDQSMPLLQRSLLRSQYTLEDTRDFAIDLLSGNQNAVMFKSAAFIKRKVKRTKARVYKTEQMTIKVWEIIKHGVQHTIHGLKDFGRDSKWLIQTKTKTQKYSQLSYSHDHRVRNIRQDMLKMIPFSVFIVVPGAEIVLPAYLKIFPNSLPSQFVSESDRKQKFKELHNRQQEAAVKLLKMLPAYLETLLDHPKVPAADKEDIKELRDSFKGEKALPSNLLEYRFFFKKYGKFSHFNSRVLVTIANFMG